jgi:hypothetical protein
MATHHGTEGLVKVDSATVAEVTGFTFTLTAEYAEDTTLADTDKTYNTIAIKSWSGNLSCFWDETDTNGQVALVPGSDIALKLYPEGATSGDTYYYGNALITDITRTVSRGAITEITFNFIGNGGLTTGTAS